MKKKVETNDSDALIAFLKYGTLTIIFILIALEMYPEFIEVMKQQDSSIIFTCYSNCTIPSCTITGDYPPESCGKIINSIRGFK